MSQKCSVDYLYQLQDYIIGLTHYEVKGSHLVQVQPIIYKLDELKEHHWNQNCPKCEEELLDN